MTIIASIISKTGKSFLISDKQASLGMQAMRLPSGKIVHIINTSILIGHAGVAAIGPIVINKLSDQVYKFRRDNKIEFIPHKVLRHLAATVIWDLTNKAGSFLQAGFILVNYDGETVHSFELEGSGFVYGESQTKKYAIGCGCIETKSYLESLDESASDEQIKEKLIDAILLTNRVNTGCGLGYTIFEMETNGKISWFTTDEDKNFFKLNN